MLRSIIVLLSCGVGYFVYAHPHCHYDQREVDVERDLTFCSMDYAPKGVCCTEAEETALEETFNAVGDLTAECADYYKQVLVVPSAEIDVMVVTYYVMQHLWLDVEIAICYLVPPTVVIQCFGPLFALSVRPFFKIFVEGITLLTMNENTHNK